MRDAKPSITTRSTLGTTKLGLVETGYGGVMHHLLDYIRELEDRASDKWNGADYTRYDKSELAPKEYFNHWVAHIGAAAQHANGVLLEKALPALEGMVRKRIQHLERTRNNDQRGAR